jgi:hypothetical protein
VSGYDTNPLVSRQKRHKNYLLAQIESESFKELKEKYTSLKIDPDKINKTKETIIICVADFPELIAKYFQ